MTTTVELFLNIYININEILLTIVVDGVWKDWAGWGECSLSCGGGIQTRFRDCNGPFHGGANCTGPDESSQACNTQPCPGQRRWRINCFSLSDLKTIDNLFVLLI